MPRNPRPLAERFWESVSVGGLGECWEWLGPKRGGYGVIEDGGRTLGAHRVSYSMVHGPIPSGTHVCHSCDNRGCVNPGHLFAGSPGDNSHDMVEKDRQAKGSRNGFSKLTESDVVEIRRSNMSQRAIAKRYGITQANVSLIRKGTTWKHVEAH